MTVAEMAKIGIKMAEIIMFFLVRRGSLL